ncbi:MAG TPA: serine hydrolase domain-containing protein, partial [Lacibacter sp.]|nr:serine hydrolase domain-containing protein [Lacibacter sp.]
RDLLTHTSGLTSVNTNMDSTVGYEGLRSCIATGATSPFPPGSVVAQTRPFQYLNVNYALFRVLIPSLWRGQPGSPFIDINDDQLTQTRYLQYMQQFVFDPINMPNINCSPEPRGIATLYYNITDSAQNRRGDFLGDWTHIAGGGGYYMTPREMARGAAFFEETQILLPNSVKQIMKQNRIGFVPRIAALETRGDYFAHDGGITNDSINNRGLQTVICIFPNGFQCSITMNTHGVTYPDNQTIIRMVYSAYNNAWLN